MGGMTTRRLAGGAKTHCRCLSFSLTRSTSHATQASTRRRHQLHASALCSCHLVRLPVFAPPHIVRIAFVPRICSTAHGLVLAQLGTDARCVQRLMLRLYESCLRRQTAHPTLHNPLKLTSGVPSLLTRFAPTALLCSAAAPYSKRLCIALTQVTRSGY